MDLSKALENMEKISLPDMLLSYCYIKNISDFYLSTEVDLFNYYVNKILDYSKNRGLANKIKNMTYDTDISSRTSKKD